MRTNLIRFKVLEGISGCNSEKKRIISSATIVLFSFFTISCTYTKLVKVEPGKDYENKKIVGFITTSGEEVTLPKGRPGTIRENVIETQGKTQKQFEIKSTDIKSTEKKPDIDGGTRYRVMTLDGKIYFTKSITNNEDKLIFTAFEPLSVPLSDVLRLKIKQISPGFIIIIASVVIILITAFTIVMAASKS